MAQETQGGLTFSAEQVKELRAYLIKQPYDVAEPILRFLAQVEAEQARQESIAKAESNGVENTKPNENEQPKTLKKVK